MKLGLGANLSVTPELTGESSSEVAFVPLLVSWTLR